MATGCAVQSARSRTSLPASEAELANNHGVKARLRSRVTTLYLEATAPGAPLANLYVAAREARRFHPTALARRLADRLAVTSSGVDLQNVRKASSTRGASPMA